MCGKVRFVDAAVPAINFPVGKIKETALVAIVLFGFFVFKAILCLLF